MEDFFKFCGLLRISELYFNLKLFFSKKKNDFEIDKIPTGYVAEMKESEFTQRAKKDDDLSNNPGFLTAENSNGVGSILPPTQHLQIRVSSKIGVASGGATPGGKFRQL